MIEDDISKVEKYNAITTDKLKEIIRDVMEHQPEDQITIYQGCKTYGAVIRSSNNLNICNNPKCLSCREWDKEMKKIITNYIKK